MAVIFLFIDGVGLGEASEANPFTRSDYPGFSTLCGSANLTQHTVEIVEKDHVFKPVDATLGIEGLPQSGTGQAALFSGKNAAKIIGKHFGPFPHSGNKHLLNEHSLFKRAQNRGKKCMFLNAYPQIFFQRARKRNRWTCTTLMAKNAAIKLNSIREVCRGEAVTSELTQEAWSKQLNLDVAQISPEQAAHRVLNQAQKYDLLLHEYYLTDKAGHSREMAKATEFLHIYDRFLQRLILQKPANTTLVLCSDHGNVEDLSVKTHTFRKVPLFALGPGAHSFSKAKSIMDVTPGILEILKE